MYGAQAHLRTLMRTLLKLGWLLMAAAGVIPAANSKFSKDLADPSSATVDVIVQFVAPPTAHQHQKATSRGGILKAELTGINGAVYSLPSAAVADLAQDPDVIYIARPSTERYAELHRGCRQRSGRLDAI